MGDPHERSTLQGRGVHALDRDVQGRRGTAVVGCRQGRRLGRGSARDRAVQREDGRAADHFPTAGGEYHRDGGSHP